MYRVKHTTHINEQVSASTVYRYVQYILAGEQRSAYYTTRKCVICVCICEQLGVEVKTENQSVRELSVRWWFRPCERVCVEAFVGMISHDHPAAAAAASIANKL